MAMPNSRLPPVRLFANYQHTGAARNAILMQQFLSRSTSKVIDTVDRLVARFESIHREQMRDLPIANPRLQVEAIGFRDYYGELLGVLITPWFMNLVLMPVAKQMSGRIQGSKSVLEFPSGAVEFTSSEDTALGSMRSAVLFRTVAEIPDQLTARSIAQTVMCDLFKAPGKQRALNRRELLTGRSVC